MLSIINLALVFWKKVYERAMFSELSKHNINCLAQQPIDVYYEEKIVGFYISDIVAENKVIIEIKAAEALHDAYEAQLTNYLRATNLEVGLLLNFGRKPAIKRKVFTHVDHKNHNDHNNQRSHS